MTLLPRIGLLIPSTNTAVEADFQRVLAGAATVHSERLFIPEGTMTPAHLDEMNHDLDHRIRSLASAKVDVIAYACTSGSFYRGPGWDDVVVQRVESQAGVRCVTTSQAVSAALERLGVRRLSVVTPYPAWTNERLVAYYQAAGFEILSIAGDERAARQGHRFVNDQPPGEIEDFALRHVSTQAEALFCSCTAWRAFEVSARIEAGIGRPVVTSNQATAWLVAERLGLMAGLGAAARARFGMLGAKAAVAA